MGIYAPVEVSGHRQDMGERDTNIGPDSTYVCDKRGQLWEFIQYLPSANVFVTSGHHDLLQWQNLPVPASTPEVPNFQPQRAMHALL
jgi:hypothetical protein